MYEIVSCPDKRAQESPDIDAKKAWHASPLFRKTIADDEIISFPEGIDKRLQTRKIIAVITIAHNNVSASRSVDPTCQGVPITLSGNRNNTGSHFLAIAGEPSVLPLSATRISADISASERNVWISRMHRGSVRRSFKQGIKIVNSGSKLDNCFIYSPYFSCSMSKNYHIQSEKSNNVIKSVKNEL